MNYSAMLKSSSSWVLACTVLFFQATIGSAQLPKETDIDRYVKQEDDAYKWEIVASQKVDGGTVLVVDMVSQNWLKPDEVNRTTWQHWMTIVVPDNRKSEVGLLLIGGGRNGGNPPQGPSKEVLQIAQATGTVVAELKMVPNQPLIFHGDGVPRVEDDLIAYTWDQFIKTGESRWLARNAMVKSAVRAMDTMTAATASVSPEVPVEKFVVAGASKRGWTTWLTGAIDDRVIAIVPIVIDVLNTDPSMRHHFAAYGYWAPSIGNYVEHRIMERMDNQKLQEAFRLVDPYYYRHRLQMPKLILNAVGDQFFLPDSSKFYWDELQGEKQIRYVPNADHGMDGSDAVESLVAFYWSIVNDKPRPQMKWEHPTANSVSVSADTKPVEVKLWQAQNESARDFRLETFGKKFESRVLQAESDGSYQASVELPKTGWRAYFVELTFDVGAPVPLKLTTDVRVVPEELPYADRSATEEGSITLRCLFPTSDAADAAAETLAERAGKAADVELMTQTDECVVYFNWVPTDGRSELGQMEAWLKDFKCQKVNVQLESGRQITTTETAD